MPLKSGLDTETHYQGEVPTHVESDPFYRWKVVAMLWSICFFNYADRQAIFSVFPLLSRDLSLDPVQLGLLGSAFASVYAVAGPLAGLVVDRMRRKTAVLVGLETWSLICAATALSRNFGALLLFRAAEGLGESIYFPASMSILASYHPGATRSTAFGIHQTSVYAGTVAGGIVAGLIGERYGWRNSFVLFGALGMGLGLVLLRYLKEPPKLDTVGSKVSFGALVEFGQTVIHTPSAALLMLAFGAVNFVAVVQLSWIPSYLYQRFHFSLALAALLATLMAQCGAALGSLIGGVIADRQSRIPGGRIVVQTVGVLLGVPCVFLCGRGSSLPIVLAALCAWGFCKGLYDASTFASLFDVLPVSMRGVATGFMNSSGWLLGGITAPVVIGYLAMRHGLGYAISLSGGVYLIAACLLVLAWKAQAGRVMTSDDR